MGEDDREIARAVNKNKIIVAARRRCCSKSIRKTLTFRLVYTAEFQNLHVHKPTYAVQLYVFISSLLVTWYPLAMVEISPDESFLQSSISTELQSSSSGVLCMYQPMVTVDEHSRSLPSGYATRMPT